MFLDCENLSDVTFPNSIESIGVQAFRGCALWENINMPDKLTTIGDEAFRESYISELILPSGLSHIGKNAFFACRYLQTAVVPSSLTSIGDGSFCICDSLRNVYYEGSSEDWQMIMIGEDNEGLDIADIHFNRDIEGQCYESHILVYHSPVPVSCTKEGTIPYYVCSVCGRCFADAGGETELVNISIPKTGHSFGSEYVYNESGHWQLCENEGCSEIAYCDKHDFVASIVGETDQVCAICGYIMGTLQHTHSAENKWYFDEITHWQTCIYCGLKINEADHVAKNEETPQSCADMQTCEICGAEFAEHELHNMVYYKAKQPTCMESGNRGYYFCSACSGYFYDKEGKTRVTNIDELFLPKESHTYLDDFWYADSQAHWRRCTTPDCNEICDYEKHSITYDPETGAEICSICGYMLHSGNDDSPENITISDVTIDTEKQIIRITITNNLSYDSAQLITAIYVSNGCMLGLDVQKLDENCCAEIAYSGQPAFAKVFILSQNLVPAYAAQKVQLDRR